jgi:hypothetical protein
LKIYFQLWSLGLLPLKGQKNHCQVPEEYRATRPSLTLNVFMENWDEFLKSKGRVGVSKGK